MQHAWIYDKRLQKFDWKTSREDPVSENRRV